MIRSAKQFREIRHDIYLSALGLPRIPRNQETKMNVALCIITKNRSQANFAIYSKAMYEQRAFPT